MRKTLAKTRNLLTLGDALSELRDRAVGIPGMALVYGASGAGKTTAIVWHSERSNGIYMRANATWTTPNALLGALLKELGCDPLGSASKNFALATERLAINPRPVFLDEADYCLGHRLLETLRDIHDSTTSPVILIGMSGIERKVAHKPQLNRRIQQFVEFRPSDLSDSQLIAAELCEVQIEDELIARLHEQSRGGIGLLVVGLSRIESWAKAQSLTSVSAAAWGSKPFFLGGTPGNG